MSAKTAPFTNNEVFQSAKELFTDNKTLSERMSAESALEISMFGLDAYRLVSRLWSKDPNWGNRVTWPVDQQQFAWLKEMQEKRSEARSLVDQKRSTVAARLKSLTNMLVDRDIQGAQPSTEYFPTQIPLVGKTRFRIGATHDPIEGRIVDVNLEGFVSQYDPEFHGDDLPAVTIQHRLSALSLRRVESTVPLIVLDAQNDIRPNFTLY